MKFMLLLLFVLFQGCASQTPKIPVVPDNETVLPYTSLPNDGEGSFA